MNDKRLHALPSMGSPIAEADLHAYADGQLAAARRAEVETFLAAHPQDRARVDAWQAQRQALRPCSTRCWTSRCRCACRCAPARLALARAGRRHRSGGVQRRRGLDRARRAGPRPDPRGAGRRGPDAERAAASYAQRAAVAHAVYAPDMGRPVEVGGDNEKALVTWLTKRLGAPSARPRCPRWAMSWSAAACCPAAPARWRCSCTARPTGSA